MDPVGLKASSPEFVPSSQAKAEADRQREMSEQAAIDEAVEVERKSAASGKGRKSRSRKSSRKTRGRKGRKGRKVTRKH
jgi:hypothetical protein